MPKKGKKGGKKGKKKGKKKAKAPANSEDIMKKLIKCYERNCALADSRMCPGIANGMRGCAENSTVLAKFILEPVTVEKEGDLPVLIDPLLSAIRQERYTFIKDVYIWGYPMTYENTATLALLLEKDIYPVKQLEMMDCLLDAPSISRFSRVFQVSEVLTKINLDYNEFRDEGCKHLCNGLERNTTLLSLSLCYCGLGVKSGAFLGNILTTTALQDLYVDGNDLQCEGAMEIIKLCAEQAEYEAAKRKRLDEEKLAAEEALKTAAKQNRLVPRPASQADSVKVVSDDGLGALDGGKKKKKKGKKKKKKEPPGPPRVGPWVHKLHIADNAIDNLEYGAKFASVMCMRLFKTLIMHSDCLDEVDLEDNCIGDLAAREILEALEHRKEEKMGGVKVRTTTKLSSDVFNSIVKLGSGLKKKKKKGKKKKK